LTFDDLKFEARKFLPGIQALAFFSNGYGASIIKGQGSYGGSEDLYELGVIKMNEDYSWDLCYTTEITDDVIGFLTPEDITSLLERIEALA
jgi:hypothetical protein